MNANQRTNQTGSNMFTGHKNAMQQKIVLQTSDEAMHF